MQQQSNALNEKLRLRAGDWVEIRSKDEILKTLDKKGQLDGLPFMAEMFAFCGRRFRVYKRAHKTCDTVFPIRGRRMNDAVHLETRCDGKAHGGCQASCLLFWKEAWLKRVKEQEAAVKSLKTEEPLRRSAPAEPGRGCVEQDVWEGTIAPGKQNEESLKYVCQNTQIPFATTELAWWDLRQYIEDFASGNVGIWQILKGAIYSGYYHLSEAGLGLGQVMRWFYDRFHWLWNGTRFPRSTGKIPVGKPTPQEVLDLKPGELVRVKSHQRILETLNTDSKNRGMSWDAEMVPYCDGTYRVLKRVTKIIDEKTGKMLEMKNPCIILDSVVCQSRYSNCRMFCPRAFYPYWREIWLERAEEGNRAVSPASIDEKPLPPAQRNPSLP
jgi:hypothetical protein